MSKPCESGVRNWADCRDDSLSGPTSRYARSPEFSVSDRYSKGRDAKRYLFLSNLAELSKEGFTHASASERRVNEEIFELYDEDEDRGV